MVVKYHVYIATSGRYRAVHTILSSTKAAQVQPRRIAYEGAAHGPSPRTASLLAKPAAVVARVGLGCQPHHQPLVHKLEIVDRALCVFRVLGVVVDYLSYSKAGTALRVAQESYLLQLSERSEDPAQVGDGNLWVDLRWI